MNSYLMEDAREAKRLADKVDPAAWVRRYLVPLNLDAGRVLDVGCGPGVIAAEIGGRFRAAEVVGVDASPNRIEAAQQTTSCHPNVAVQIGDALELPFADDSFDFVLCRFLLEYLTDKQRAIQEMKRVLKPNGRLLLQDLDGQLIWHYPMDEFLKCGITEVLRQLEASGFDPMVGRKLFNLCHTAGFEKVDASVEPYHVIAGAIDAENRALWKTKLEIAEKKLQESLAPNVNASALRRRFLEYLDRSDTLTYSVLFSVLATKGGASQD